MLKVLIIGLGGFIGAIIRYALSSVVTNFTPLSPYWGTMTVNIVGCLAFGIIIQLIDLRQIIQPELKIFLLIGLLGSFTTFSTFAYESFSLMKNEQYWTMAFNITSQVALGISALWLGMYLSRWIKM